MAQLFMGDDQSNLVPSFLRKEGCFLRFQNYVTPFGEVVTLNAALVQWAVGEQALCLMHIFPQKIRGFETFLKSVSCIPPRFFKVFILLLQLPFFIEIFLFLFFGVFQDTILSTVACFLLEKECVFLYEGMLHNE